MALVPSDSTTHNNPEALGQEGDLWISAPHLSLENTLTPTVCLRGAFFCLHPLDNYTSEPGSFANWTFFSWSWAQEQHRIKCVWRNRIISQIGLVINCPQSWILNLTYFLEETDQYGSSARCKDRCYYSCLLLSRDAMFSENASNLQTRNSIAGAFSLKMALMMHEVCRVCQYRDGTH